jgi:ABC-2 type transport system ATP-binding protein
MLQTGALIGDLSVRELVAMMASLYPRPLDVEDVLEMTGVLSAKPAGAYTAGS